MNLKEFLKEAMSLEKALNEPAALWIQGLKDKEYNKLIKIMNSDYNEAYTTKKLQKAFPDLTGNIYHEFKKLSRKAIVAAVPKDEIYIKGYESNFLGIGLNISIDKGKILKNAFDEIRN